MAVFICLSRRVTVTSMQRCPERTWSGCWNREVSQTWVDSLLWHNVFGCVSHYFLRLRFDVVLKWVWLTSLTSWNVCILFLGFLQGQDDIDHTQQEEDKLGHILTPEIPRYVQCQWAPLSELDPDTLTFPGGAPVQLHSVPPALLPKIPLYYVCTRCGKVFWEGSHFGRVLSMFQDVLHITDTEAAAAAQQNWHLSSDCTLPDLKYFHI